MTGTRVRFNPFAADFRRDPYPHYRALREAPVQRTLGMWVLTRHADVRAVLHDRTTSAELIPQQVSRRGNAATTAAVERILRLGRASLVFTDNPAHARLRALVNKVFTPGAVAQLRPRVAELAERRVAAIWAQGGGDVVAELAAPLPVETLCDWMDLPEPMRAHVPDWTHTVRFLLEPGLLTEASLGRVGEQLEAFVVALEPVIARPGDDLVGRLRAARTGPGERLTEEEVAFLCIMCFVAGTETTSALVAGAVLALLQHPDQAELLHARPDLVPAAVREALRYVTPLQMTKRLATRDLHVGEVEIRAGEQVLLCLAAANRDPAAFPEPDRFDITRDTAGHLGFGHGMHGCLGGTLAEQQAAAALAALFRRPERLQVAAEILEWQTDSSIVRSPVALPVTVGPAW